MDEVQATQAQQDTLRPLTDNNTLYCLQELFTYVIPDVQLQDEYKSNLSSK